MLIIPARSREFWLTHRDKSARYWLDQLPRLSAELLDRWSCVPVGDARAGYGVLVVPVRAALTVPEPC